MTIKRRLFISNLIMTVAPFIISIATVVMGIFILNILTNGEYELLRGGGIGSRATHLAGNGSLAILLSIGVVLFFCAVVILTNRLLTKFVFRKIMHPLEVLANGVQHISDGDLDYRITHSEQDEFKPICDAFNDMAVRLKVADDIVQKNEQNRKELFSGISHDLRSPLTSIKAFAEGLLDGVASTPEAQQEYLNIIKQKSEEVNSMVSQLFLYSKMDMGNYPTNPEILDIGKEIGEFISASKEEYKTIGLSIKVIGTFSKINIYADPLQFRSIFANILENSAKYKIADTVESTIYCTASDESVNIIIEDNGPGVSEESLPRLFEAFYRADPSRNNPSQGSGLGLAIVQKAIERMGGSIRAENVDKGGLRVTMRIPIIKSGKENMPHEKSFDY